MRNDAGIRHQTREKVRTDKMKTAGKMKNKINSKMTMVALLSILMTMICMVFVFYNILKDQIIEDLQVYISILEGTDDLESASQADVRITLISKDGKVLFDNRVQSMEMGNHKDRPEIVRAMETGEGFAVRKSATLSRNTYYYAKKLADGNILRVARESSNILHIVVRILPTVVLILMILILFCLYISRLLTANLVRPIEEIAKDIDHMDTVQGYEELEPFIRTINEQHRDIVKNANMRQEFTANVSHELKTPLTSISGYSELIENGMANESDMRRFGKEIHRNAGRLLTLINDIIRLSELDSADVSEQEFEKLDLYGLAQTCVEMLQVHADNHHVTLSLQGKKSIVYGNKQMLEELLYNLCDNAIRYNIENGMVIVTVDEEDDTVFLSVRDTGIGISKENQERIFERFYRVDKSRSKQTGGTGLGLAIVKHIVASHHAKLEIESEERKGTKIKVIFV